MGSLTRGGGIFALCPQAAWLIRGLGTHNATPAVSPACHPRPSTGQRAGDPGGRSPRRSQSTSFSAPAVCDREASRQGRYRVGPYRRRTVRAWRRPATTQSVCGDGDRGGSRWAGEAETSDLMSFERQVVRQRPKEARRQTANGRKTDRQRQGHDEEKTK